MIWIALVLAWVVIAVSGAYTLDCVDRNKQIQKQIAAGEDELVRALELKEWNR